MNKAATIIILFTFLCQFSFSQQEPKTNFNITISDNAGNEKILKFGLSAEATDSIDETLGEADLPPFPPIGALEARWILPMENFSGSTSSYNDYRNCTFPFTGQKEHRLWYQTGTGGTAIIIRWDVPQTVSGILQDIITGTLINIPVHDTGSYVIENPAAFDKMKLVINYDNISRIIDKFDVPLEFGLEQNFPNPFNPTTIINFSVKKSSDISLNVYDVVGRKVKELIKGYYSAGDYRMSFDATGLASGIYYYRLVSENITLSRKMALVR